MRRSRSAVAAAVAAALVVGGSGAAATTAPPSGAALAALSQAPVRTAIASDRIYFLLTDRYANGDPGNDRGGGSGGRAATGFDPTDPGWYHGGDLKGLTGDCADPGRGLARIKALGFTAIWVTPPFGQQTVQSSSAAYHGYWIRDFTTVDRHLGSEADFKAMVGCAHRLGLRVYLDVVVNHTADLITPSGGAAWLGPDAKPYRDCRGRVFSPARYTGSRPFPCLRAATMPRPPFVLPADRTARKPAWLNDTRRYHNRGEVEFSSCSVLCYEQGDIFGLDDLFTEQAAVVNGLASVYASWIARFEVDGFRIDTARHVDRAFFGRWVPKIRAAARAAGVKEFELFGEVFVADAVEASAYVRDRGLPNSLDFPLQDALVRFAGGDASARGIGARLGDDDYARTAERGRAEPADLPRQPRPGPGGAAALRARAGRLVRRAAAARPARPRPALPAPRRAVVLYGDEVGMIGSGGDKAAREDMFSRRCRRGGPSRGSARRRWGRFVLRRRSASRRGAASSARQAPRRASRARARLFDGAGLVREAARRQPLRRRLAARVPDRLQRRHRGGECDRADGDALVAVDGVARPGRRGERGGRTARAERPGLTTVVLRADAQVPAAAPAVPALKVGADDLTDLVRVSATAGAAPVSVAFAVQRGGGPWRRLAVDDSPPYRAFLEPGRYRRGERVSLVAVARGLDGRIAVSKVVTAVPRRSPR